MKIYSNYILKLSSIYIIIKKNKLITNKQKKKQIINIQHSKLKYNIIAYIIFIYRVNIIFSYKFFFLIFIPCKNWNLKKLNYFLIFKF